MGNACSDSYNSKFRSKSYEISISDFRRCYKQFKFPRNLTFTHDSKLFRVRYLPTHDARILRRITFSDEKDLYLFMHNLARIVKLDHASLLKIHHFSIEESQLKGQTISYTLNIVFENFSHTLQDEIEWRSKSNQQFTEEEVQSIVNNLTDALEFLELNKFNHGNIKPSKIYITHEKEYKIMYLGDLSSEIQHKGSEECKSHTSVGNIAYYSPQKRKQVIEKLFMDKTLTFNEALGQNNKIVYNPYKSDVFSLGLVTLEMMSTKGIEGLNGDFCDSKRKYRIMQCAQTFSPTLCNLTETMLKESERNRPDFTDLKKMIIMNEYLGYRKAQGGEERYLRIEDERKGVIEMKMMENKSEYQIPQNYLLDSSEETELSILKEMSDEYNSRKNIEKDHENLSNIDMSPTKAYTNHTKEGSNGRKDSRKDISDGLSGGLEEEKGEEELSEVFDEMFIDKEKDLISARFVTLTKLIINFEEKPYFQETSTAIRELLGCQLSLNELVLSLPKAKLGDEGLATICDGLCKTKKMALCFLDFRKNKLTDKSVSLLTKGLSEKSHFTQLGVNLSDNKITEEGCKEISEWFGELRNVESFALNLGGNKIGSRGAEVIGKELGKLNKVESLVIFLHSNEIEGKEGVSVLFSELCKMKSLKRLKIDLSGNLLGDDEMDIVSEFIKENEIGELVIELKDNCLSYERKKELVNLISEKEMSRIIL